MEKLLLVTDVLRRKKTLCDKNAETKSITLNIDELVSKLKPESVKKDKRKVVEAYISSAEGKNIKAKINIKWENNPNPQVFEISVSGMSSAVVGSKIKVCLNSFSKSQPTNGSITN